MNSQNRKEITELIRNGETDEALNRLLQIIPESNKHFERFILLQGQWKSALHQVHLGLEDRRSVSTEFNRITNATLEYLKNLPDILVTPHESRNNSLRELVNQYSTNNSSKFQYDLFLSFSNIDLANAKYLCDNLRGYGLTVFFSADDMRLKGGHKFSEVIDNALESSKNFLLYSTPNSMKSEWVSLEYTTFHDQIHVKDKNNRLFLIYEGVYFSEEYLRITYRNNQRVKDIDEVLHILVPPSKTSSLNKNHLNSKDKTDAVKPHERQENLAKNTENVKSTNQASSEDNVPNKKNEVAAQNFPFKVENLFKSKLEKKTTSIVILGILTVMAIPFCYSEFLNWTYNGGVLGNFFMNRPISVLMGVIPLCLLIYLSITSPGYIYFCTVNDKLYFYFKETWDEPTEYLDKEFIESVTQTHSNPSLTNPDLKAFNINNLARFALEVDSVNYLANGRRLIFISNSHKETFSYNLYWKRTRIGKGTLNHIAQYLRKLNPDIKLG